MEVLKFELGSKNCLKNWHAGSWLSRLPLTKIRFDKSAGTSGWSVPISSQLMSSFVGIGLMSGPLPLRNLEVSHPFRWFTQTHTQTLPQQGLFGRSQAVDVLMPCVGGEVGSAGSDWKVGRYGWWLRWLLSGKLLRKHGRLMTKGLKPAIWQSAGTPREAPDRNSQSREGSVQRTSSSARGIHVASCGAAEARRRMAAKEHDGR